MMMPLLFGAVVVAIVLSVVARVSRRRRAPAMFGVPADNDTPIAVVDAWYRLRRDDGALTELVDDRAWRDLEMDGVLRAVDHCHTPLGRQQLVAALRSRSTPADRDRLSALADHLAADPPLRERVAKALAAHTGHGGYAIAQLLRANSLGGPLLPWAPFVTTLGIALLVSAVWVPLALVAFVPLAMFGLILRTFASGTVSPYIGPFCELAPVLHAARTLAKISHPAMTAFESALRPRNVSLARLERIASLVGRDVATTNDLVGSLYEYVNIVLMIDANALLAVRRELRERRSALETMCIAVGEIDVALSLASLRSTLPRWCRPTHLAEPASLEMRGAVHPILSDGVANDIVLSRGRGILLTGANMSGKSTVLRMLGVNVILGNALATCTALEANLPVDRVFTCIGHADDISAGKSLFLTEAELVVRLMASAQETSALFVFDELFRGTNAAERISAAEAVAREIVSASGGQYVAMATHDLSLSRLLADRFETWHLAVDISGGDVDFRFQLAPGPATTRTALALLTRLGAPKRVIAAATSRAGALEQRTNDEAAP